MPRRWLPALTAILMCRRALRTYEASRLPRTTRVQRDASRNGTVYHLRGAGAALRSLALMAMGGDRLISRYDWLYGWTLAERI